MTFSEAFIALEDIFYNAGYPTCEFNLEASVWRRQPHITFGYVFACFDKEVRLSLGTLILGSVTTDRHLKEQQELINNLSEGFGRLGDDLSDYGTKLRQLEVDEASSHRKIKLLERKITSLEHSVYCMEMKIPRGYALVKNQKGS